MSQHLCEAIVITCMDWRKHDTDFLREIKKVTHFRNCDLVSLAGGAKTLLDDEDRPVVLKQIAKSRDLHGITRVILIAHTDCGAYGGFGTPERLARDLAEAKDIVKRRFPSLEVQTFVCRLSPHGESWSVDFITAEQAINDAVAA